MNAQCVLIAALCLLPAVAAAQSGQPSLADVARQAELAKPTVPKAKKTYTNADLSGGGLPPETATTGVAPKPSGNQSAATAKPGEAPAATAAPAEVQSEEVWRRRADRIRDQAKSMTARLADLTSRPPNPNANLQQRVEKEITGIRSDFVQLRLRWTQLEQDARAAKVDILWIEPAPAFPQ